MPFLLGLIGIVAAAYFWMSRVRNAAQMTHELAGVAGDVMAAARRLGFRRRLNLHPVESVDEPKLAIAGLAIAFLELGGLPTAEQQNAAMVALQNHTDLTPKAAEENLILGRWLVTECGGAQPAIARLSRRLVKLDRGQSLSPLMAVLNDIGIAGRTGLSGNQREALAEIARAFRIV